VKTENEASFKLDLMEYVDEKGLRIALIKAGCQVPADFHKMLDLHLQTLFFRYRDQSKTDDAKEPACRYPLYRDQISRELRMLLGGGIERDPTRSFFIRCRKNLIVAWKSEYHKPVKKLNELGDDAKAVLALLQERLPDKDLPFETAVVRKTFVPKSLKSRSGGRDKVKFVFTPGSPSVQILWPDQKRHGRPGKSENEIVIGVPELGDALLLMDPTAYAGVLTIAPNTASLPAGRHLVLRSEYRYVIIFNKDS
jgi:hypothetical protein